VVARGGARPAAPDPARGLVDPAFVDAFVPLLHDDAVVRWLAFVDAEWLSAFGVAFDLVAWLRDVTAPAPRRDALAALLRRRRRWWQPGLEEARFAEAASDRLARAAIAALAAAPTGDPDAAVVAATLRYPIVAALNGEIDRILDAEGAG
jgi:hypothetical protein